MMILVPCWLQLLVRRACLTSLFGEPRLLTCSRACPQPVVWMAPACAGFLCATAVLSGHVPSPWFDEPRQARRVLRAAAVLPGHVPSPWFDEPWRARLLPASPSLQLPPLAACVPPRLRRCSCLRSLPVRRRFSAAAAASAPFSAACALRAVCFGLRYV